MDGPILLWSLWPCLSPSLPLFIKACRDRRFRFSTIHHLISVIIFLSVNHLEVIYFDSQHVPCKRHPPHLCLCQRSQSCWFVIVGLSVPPWTCTPSGFAQQLLGVDHKKKVFYSHTLRLEVFSGIVGSKHLRLSASEALLHVEAVRSEHSGANQWHWRLLSRSHSIVATRKEFTKCHALLFAERSVSFLDDHCGRLNMD